MHAWIQEEQEDLAQAFLSAYLQRQHTYIHTHIHTYMNTGGARRTCTGFPERVPAMAWSNLQRRQRYCARSAWRKYSSVGLQRLSRKCTCAECIKGLRRGGPCPVAAADCWYGCWFGASCTGYVCVSLSVCFVFLFEYVYVCIYLHCIICICTHNLCVY